MKFAHFADCHLGSWRQPELNCLNLQSFQRAVSISIKEKVDFILIAGDLFESAYPSIDTLKEAFGEFKTLKEAKIPVFIIAGSHDYSVSGKTFIDVLEKGGFCRNVAIFEERNNEIILQPSIYKNFAIFGYPGKKSGLEIDEVERIKLEDCPGFFKILMLHTTLRSAVSNPYILAVDDSKLPQVNYLALGHLHISLVKNLKVYPGPIFPNNLSELEELQHGSFFIYNNGSLEKKEIKIKDVALIQYNTNNTLKATEEIIHLIDAHQIKDKIVILKISGIIEHGRTSDIDFNSIENYAKKRGAWLLLKNTSRLSLPESELKLDVINTEDMESEIIKKFAESHHSRFNSLIHPLVKTLQIEKIYDEKSALFEERLLSEVRKVIEPCE